MSSRHWEEKARVSPLATRRVEGQPVPHETLLQNQAKNKTGEVERRKHGKMERQRQ